eukprot:scaffold125124_cov24-Tisochrysis_lutea.AAC.1
MLHMSAQHVGPWLGMEHLYACIHTCHASLYMRAAFRLKKTGSLERVLDVSAWLVLYSYSEAFPLKASLA